MDKSLRFWNEEKIQKNIFVRVTINSCFNGFNKIPIGIDNRNLSGTHDKPQDRPITFISRDNILTNHNAPSPHHQPRI